MIVSTAYGGYIAPEKELEEWSAKQTDPDYVRFREMSHTGCYGIFRRYLAHLKLNNLLDLEVLPTQLDERGRTDTSRPYLMFCMIKTQPVIFPGHPFNWKDFQETDLDRKYKKALEDLGVPIQSWIVVCRVGRIGVFYNFGPETLRRVHKRIKRIREKQEQKSQEATPIASEPVATE
ncbi:hypothetical protein FRC12_006431 [Ceratobasidium sp. 428]|nr:hypothetical protein FRC12_006431 [Ceratobasidium sp. 428]